VRAPVTSHDIRSAALGCGLSAATLGAIRASRRAAGRRRLRREVSTAMTTGVVTIPRDATLADAAVRLADAEAGALPVCDGGDRLVGVITDRDIVVRAVAHGEDLGRMRVGDCITPDPATVAPLTTLEEASELMERHAVRRLPVVLDGRVVGMLSEHDLALRAPRSRVGEMLARVAAAPSDQASAAWLFQRAHDVN
jgi:CBS domain-containing protein